MATDYTISGTTANTTYNVFAFWNGTETKLEFVAESVGHMLHTDGNRVKPDDVTRTLVGKVRIGATANQLAPGISAISWRNRRPRLARQLINGVTRTFNTNY